MRHLRWTLAAAVALALCASSPAPAHPPHGGGAVITPSNSHEMTEWYKTMIELPVPVNPLLGWGDDPCVRMGAHDRILVAISFGDVSCTAEVGTVVTTGGGHFCDDFEPPPWFAEGWRAQLRCAWRPARRRRCGSASTAARGSTSSGRSSRPS